MALSSGDRAWFIGEIQRLDPTGDIVEVLSAGARLRYTDKIRSDETLLRNADPEELVRALIICLLCSDAYGYAPERMYMEQTHTIGRPSSSGAQVDLIIYYLEGGAETAFAMWEMKAPDAYHPANDPLIEKQLFSTAPLISPSFLVYATVKPRTADIECITIDHKAYKTYARWDMAGRPAT